MPSRIKGKGAKQVKVVGLYLCVALARQGLSIVERQLHDYNIGGKASEEQVLLDGACPPRRNFVGETIAHGHVFRVVIAIDLFARVKPEIIQLIGPASVVTKD